MSTVALVGPSWPLRGGIARTTTTLASTLDARGELAAFFVPRRQYPAWLYPGRRDTDASACPRLPLAKSCFSVMAPWSWLRLARRLRLLEARALVLPYWTAAWAPLDLFLARFTPLPIVSVVHNPADHDSGPVARRAARAVLGRSAAYFCHAAEVERRVASIFPGRPTAVHPLPPERIDMGTARRQAARSRLGVPPDRVAVLCFGLIRPYKGVDVLLDAFAQAPAGCPLVLLLAGEPWGRTAEALRRRITTPELAGRVVSHLAWVPEDEVGDWFAAADAAVLPYRSATGSAVAAQALGYGLPIVGSAVGGIRDVVGDGTTGLLVPPGNPNALATALAKIADPSLRCRLRAGVEDAVRRWSWASYAAALQGLIEQLVEREQPIMAGTRRG